MGPQDEPASLCRAPLAGSRFPGDTCSRDVHLPAVGVGCDGSGASWGLLLFAHQMSTRQ